MSSISKGALAAAFEPKFEGEPPPGPGHEQKNERHLADHHVGLGVVSVPESSRSVHSVAVAGTGDRKPRVFYVAHRVEETEQEDPDVYQSVDENLHDDADELRLEPFDAHDHIVVARCQAVLEQDVPDEYGDHVNADVDSRDDVGSENLLT